MKQSILSSSTPTFQAILNEIKITRIAYFIRIYHEYNFQKEQQKAIAILIFAKPANNVSCETFTIKVPRETIKITQVFLTYLPVIQYRLINNSLFIGKFTYNSTFW